MTSSSRTVSNVTRSVPHIKPTYDLQAHSLRALVFIWICHCEVFSTKLI